MKRFFTVLLLAGCAELPLTQDRVDAIVADAVNAARAPVAEQKVAISRAQQSFDREQNPANRLRLALLLATLPAPLRDDARALQLLEPIADAASPGIGRFAAFLAPQLAERQRVARDIERLSRDIERLTRERERSEKERVAADRERDKREEALRQQLEALRSIERGILEREDRLRKRR